MKSRGNGEVEAGLSSLVQPCEVLQLQWRETAGSILNTVHMCFSILKPTHLNLFD